MLMILMTIRTVNRIVLVMIGVRGSIISVLMILMTIRIDENNDHDNDNDTINKRSIMHAWYTNNSGT